METMKSIQKTILALAALTLAACATNDMQENGTDDTDRPHLKLAAIPAGQAATRAEVGIQTAVFDADELLQAYIWHEEDVAANGQNQNNYFEPLLTAMEPEGSVNPLYADRYLLGPANPDQHISLYALYPSWVKNDATTFTVSADQTEDGNAEIQASDVEANETARGYKGSDLMFGSRTSVPATESPVLITFSHKMAKIIVNAQNDGTVAGLIIQSIKLKGFKRTIGFNATTGVLGDAGTLADPSDIVMSNYGAALLPPKQTVAADANFIEVTTNKGVAMFKLDADLLLQESHQYTFNLEIGMQSMTVRATTITNWSDDATSATITPLGEGEFAISHIDEVLYNAAAHEPDFSVQTSEGVFASTSSGFDERFTKGYYGNVNAGEAVVLVTGKAGTAYEGKVASQTFTIQPKALTLAFAADIPAVDYNATEQTAEITMTDPDSHVVLNSTDHYTATNDTHTNANEDGYIVTITGKGNYTGSIEKSFVIHKVAGELVKNSPSAASVVLNPTTTSQEFNITFMGGTLNVTTTATDENEISLNNTMAESTGNTDYQFSTTVTQNSKQFSGTVTFSVEPDENHTAPTSITCNVGVGVTLANSAVGNRVDANGYAYPAAVTSVTSIGMVAYKKDDGTGIVMAKNTMTGAQMWEDIATSSNTPKNLNSSGNLNNTVVPGKNWICGTETDYRNFIITTAGSSSFSALNTKLTAAGCSTITGNGENENHLTSTLDSNSRPRIFYKHASEDRYEYGITKKGATYSGGSYNHVRPIFTF
jgi:hypothetical protein